MNREVSMNLNTRSCLNKIIPLFILVNILIFFFSIDDAVANIGKHKFDPQFYLKEYCFNGNEYIGIPKYPKIEKEITILCFFKPAKEAFKNCASLICRWMETDGYQSYNICLTEDYHIKIWLEICADDSRINHNVGLTVSKQAKIDEWQHIALIYNGKDIKAYYNSILDSDKIFSGQLISPKSPDLLLGAKENFVDFTKGNLFKGILREVYIFNKSLSEEEIRMLYTEGLEQIQREKKI